MLKGDSPNSLHAISLYDPQRLQVRVDVPLADAAKIGVGQQAEIVVEVLPEQVFKGRITRVLHEADIQKNTLEVKVAIQDPVSQLRPEMLARVKFMSGEQKNEKQTTLRIMAPVRSFSQENGSSYAWTLNGFDGAHGTAKRRAVQLSSTPQQDWVEVLDGLQQGDLLITQASSALKENQRVKVSGDMAPGA